MVTMRGLTVLTKIKILLTIKIVAIVLLLLLTLLWRNSFSPAFTFSVILFTSFLAIGAIVDYIAYTILKLLDENLKSILEDNTKNK